MRARLKRVGEFVNHQRTDESDGWPPEWNDWTDSWKGNELTCWCIIVWNAFEQGQGERQQQKQHDEDHDDGTGPQ